MKSGFKRHSLRTIILISVITTFVISFQNCAPGFEALQTGSGGGSGLQTPDPELPADVPLDPTASLSVYARSARVLEGGELKFKVELNKASTSPISVNLKTVDGSAVATTDFDEYIGSVTIPAGQLSVEVPVQTLVFQLSTRSRQMNLEIVSVSTGQIGQKTATGLLKASQKVLNFKQVSAGNGHVCAITAQDTVKCWGTNYTGQLGNGTQSPAVLVPVDVLNLTGIKRISSGDQHSCALTATGTVKCWGSNSFGELGDGTTTRSSLPKDVLGLTGVKEVAVGQGHTCVITAQDTVKCWGANTYGQLGNGTTTVSLVPVDVLNLTGVGQISGLGNHTCARTTEGKVKCWGLNTSGQLGNGVTVDSATPVDVSNFTNVKEIIAASTHTCVITAQETVKCWGGNGGGELGNGNTSAPVLVPVDVLNLTNVKAISLGPFNSCATTGQGAVKCWGNNTYGQLGNGTRVASSLPVDVLNLTDVKQISMGSGFGCAVTSQDTVKCWGANSGLRLGNGATGSVVVVDLFKSGGFKQIAAGIEHACAITAQGTVKCWGKGGNGELGNGTMLDSAVTVDVSDLTGVKEIVAGDSYTCAITAQDTVKCWGQNYLGQLGNGTGVSSSVPVNVLDLDGVRHIYGANYHACALLSDGTVKCWGYNTFGQLGDSTNMKYNTLAPVIVVGLTGVKQVAAATYNTCVITAQETVKCWGANYSGALGDGTTTNSRVPVDVLNLAGVKQIAIGEYHGCAITAQDAVKCWGIQGQATGGTAMEILGFRGAKIAAGSSHTCGVTAQDTVKCWGANGAGQLGNGTISDSMLPVDVLNLSSIQQISLRGQGLYALRKDGRVRHVGHGQTVLKAPGADVTALGF